jgi:hypothetical protein
MGKLRWLAGVRAGKSEEKKAMAKKQKVVSLTAKELEICLEKLLHRKYSHEFKVKFSDVHMTVDYDHFPFEISANVYATLS